VALHLEPYHGRSALTVSDDFEYIIGKFGAHPALHRTSAGSAYGDARQLPVLYIYDSYRIAMRDWQQVLLPMRSKSVRSCACRCCFCVFTSARDTERETEKLRNTHTPAHTHTHTWTQTQRRRHRNLETRIHTRNWTETQERNLRNTNTHTHTHTHTHRHGGRRR
jgi:hypothetical protein